MHESVESLWPLPASLPDAPQTLIAAPVPAAFNASGLGLLEKPFCTEAVGTGGSQASTATSTQVMVEDAALTPTSIDIKRLAKMKAEQERKLKSIRARVDHLGAAERRVWKDVTCTQQMSLQAQEAQVRRQSEQAERLRHEREQMARLQALRGRTQQLRQRAVETKGLPKLLKFEENQAVAQKAREDSRRLAAAMQDARDRTLHSKAMQVEVRRQQQRQQRLRRELHRAQVDKARQDEAAAKYAELQEEMRNVDNAIAEAECEEMTAVSRLQHSQTVRAGVLAHLQATKTDGVDSQVEDEAPHCQILVNGLVGSVGTRLSHGGAGNLPVASSPRQRLLNGGGSGHVGTSSAGSLGSLLGHSGLDQITEEDDGMLEQKAERRSRSMSPPSSNMSPHSSKEGFGPKGALAGSRSSALLGASPRLIRGSSSSAAAATAAMIAAAQAAKHASASLAAAGSSSEPCIGSPYRSADTSGYLSPRSSPSSKPSPRSSPLGRVSGVSAAGVMGANVVSASRRLR